MDSHERGLCLAILRKERRMFEETILRQSAAGRESRLMY